jgi:prepilin-type N-terminal cleavage/methylation domain-containing protein
MPKRKLEKSGGGKEMTTLVKELKGNCIHTDGTEADRVFANSYKAGLTLIELMVVMILSLVLVGSAFMAHLAYSKTGQEQHKVASLQQDLRAVIDLIDRDVRNSGCTDPRLASVSAIQATSSGVNSLGLNMDMDLNGSTTASGERVRYLLVNSTLQRTDQGATTTLLNNVTTFGIAYFDQNNAPIVPAGTLTQAQASSVLSIAVSLGLQSQNIDPNTGQTTKRLLRRRMQSRNQEILLKGM